MTRSTVVLSVAAVLAAALVTAGSVVADAATVCGTTAAPTVSQVGIDQAQNAKFSGYANSTPDGWTGGDSTFSVVLPRGGGRLWMFSDSFLGPVNADGSRPVTSRMPNQSFVLERDGSLTTTIVTGPGVVPRPARGWYWLRQGVVNGSELQVPLSHFDNVNGALTFLGTDIARFATTDLATPIAVAGGPSATSVQWGSWVQREGGRTYIYGTEDLGLAKYMKVARVEGTDLTGTWRYYQGGSWTNSANWAPDETRAVRLGLGSTTYGVSNEYSVHRLGSRLWVLVTMDTTVASNDGTNFSDDIVAYFSCTPVGPFVAKTLMYETPETGPSPVYGGDPDIYTYNPHSHPEYVDVRNPGRLVVSYNVNSVDTRLSATGDLYRDATIYRPRFIDVQFAGVR